MTDQNKTHGVLTDCNATPRVNEITDKWVDSGDSRSKTFVVLRDLARTLERQLNWAHRELDQLRALQSPVAPADDEDAAELIVRDVCELDPANPDLNDTVCVDVSDLLIIAKRHTADRARLADASTVSATVPDGWRLVPVEPTPAMQAAGAQSISFDTTVLNKIWSGNAAYRAMIAAAPTPPTSAADADLLAILARVADDFEDCGETEVTGCELAAMAQRGWLDCTRYVVTPQGYAAIAASKGTT